jgi:quinol monooxygenase YgiN
MSCLQPTNNNNPTGVTTTINSVIPIGPSYEMKFLVSPEVAERAQDWARGNLPVDPHADPERNDSYRVLSAYCDTDRLDVYRRSPAYRRSKYRIRRYGDEPLAFLERKSRTGDRVSKRRVLVDEPDLARLELPITDEGWEAGWFHERLIGLQLRPRMLVRYQRSAYLEPRETGPLRLTLDRSLEAAPAAGFCFEPCGAFRPMLVDRVILELKFCAAMPALYKGLMRDLGLTPSAVSKYRRAVDASGMEGAAPSARGRDGARPCSWSGA